MNLKPNELAQLAAGVVSTDLSLRAADSLAKLLPNIGRAAAAIQDSYNARQLGSLETDYASLEKCRQALLTFHSRVAARLTPRGQSLILTEIDKKFADVASYKELLAQPLTKAEISQRIESLCKIIDNPQRAADRPLAELHAKQLVPEIARQGALSIAEASERVSEIVSGGSPAILFQRAKFPAPVAAQSASPNKPLFFTVTGRDFGRSIRWARSTPNALTSAIRAATARFRSTDPERPSPEQVAAEMANAQAADARERVAAELALDTGTRMAEAEGIAKAEAALPKPSTPPRPSNELRASSLRAQLQSRPAPSSPVTIAQAAAAVPASLRPSLA